MSWPLLRGPALRPGDTIGIVAPASGFHEAALLRGLARLESLGYRVKLGSHVHDRVPQYFAGTPEQRAADLHAMFLDQSVRAILCARGGYGSQALLSLIDLDVVRQNPKPIVGCSDITVLQSWLLEQTGLVCLHGPMAAGDFAREEGQVAASDDSRFVDLASWNACLTGEPEWQLAAASGLHTLKPGTARGRLYGGCLSLLVSTLGTTHELLRVPAEDMVLFLEDIGEKPYQIDRMLTQWRAAGKLDRVSGIVFGEMLGCEQSGVTYTLRDVLQRVLADFPGPVAFGLRSGHVSHANVTLPLGIACELDCGDHATLTFKGPATITA
jgi:muramoyltetrapeptide carboxypeptidase